jgi:hypothetical protein
VNAPVRLVHKPCGREAIAEHRCAHCGEIIRHTDVHAEAGPGATLRTSARFATAGES